jgi:putative ABC transport system permease protein
LDLGFDPRNVLTFSLRGTDDSTPTTRAQDDDLLDRMLGRLESDPRVVAAGAVNTLPLVSGPIGWDTSVLLEGQREDAPESWSGNPNLNFLAVTPQYFRSMGIRLIQGRLFTDQDHVNAPYVVIVSQALADRLWPGQNPVGKRLRTGFLVKRDDNVKAGLQTVVGVVATARYREIQTPRLDLYVPFRQADPIAEFFVIRTTVPPEPLVPTLTAALREMSPYSRVDRVTTMDSIVRRTRGPWLFSATVFSLFGLVALGLSCLGLFALVAYTVSHRTHEIGVRMALGALPRDVIALMLRQGLVPTLYGLLLGVVCAFFGTRVVASLLFETSPTDVSTFAEVAVGFAVASVLASYVPARRAASVSPLVALRGE